MKSVVPSWFELCRITTVTCILACATLPSAVAGEAPSRFSNYLLDGATVTGWQLTLGDESNWYQPQNEDMGLSFNKTISFNHQDNNLNVRWRSSSEPGLVYISGQPIDLSGLDAKSIALALELKVHTEKLKHPIQLSMSCGYPCQGTVTLNPFLEAYPRNEWFILPLPLSCFKNAGTDFSKVDAPLSIYTTGKLYLSFRKVWLAKIPADLDLCKDK